MRRRDRGGPDRRTEFNPGRAAALVEERVSRSVAYREARALTIEHALNALLQIRSVSEFRVAGGRTAVIKRAMDRAIGESAPAVYEAMGSQMFPTTPADVLRSNLTVLVQEISKLEMQARQARGEVW